MRVKTGLPLTLGIVCLLGLNPAHADPFNTDDVTDEVAYESPLSAYVADQEDEPGNWIAANQRVGEIGGWRTYLRQAQEPLNNDANAPTEPPAPDLMPGMHPTPAQEAK